MENLKNEMLAKKYAQAVDGAMCTDYKLQAPVTWYWSQVRNTNLYKRVNLAWLGSS